MDQRQHLLIATEQIAISLDNIDMKLSSIDLYPPKSDQDRWWEAYCVALSGLIAGQWSTTPEDLRLRAASIANESLIAFNKEWNEL